jgi:hypothetical protein
MVLLISRSVQHVEQDLHGSEKPAKVLVFGPITPSAGDKIPSTVQQFLLPSVTPAIGRMLLTWSWGVQ